MPKGKKHVLRKAEENTKLYNTLDVLQKVKMSFLRDTSKSL